MTNAKEFPLSKQEAQVLTEAWHARRGSALLMPGEQDVESAFQIDLIDAARRISAFQYEPGRYSYGLSTEGFPVLRWARQASGDIKQLVAGASLSIGCRGIDLEINPDGSVVIAKAQ
ncbi:hypothetical protein [Pseudomonas sp. GTC 16473]|uniref:hypothetical protein n=1 Tax=Pseudomonas sp. GTC 16473 TaxID=1661060 RepID=UPI00086368F5|nr:hypothetical protein [Pseudomonas sp. GTC 16473]